MSSCADAKPKFYFLVTLGKEKAKNPKDGRNRWPYSGHIRHKSNNKRQRPFPAPSPLPADVCRLIRPVARLQSRPPRPAPRCQPAGGQGDAPAPRAPGSDGSGAEGRPPARLSPGPGRAGGGSAGRSYRCCRRQPEQSHGARNSQQPTAFLC